MKRIPAAATLLLVLGAMSPAWANDAKPDISKYMVGEKKSGYIYAEPETRSMQDDDFSNPGMLWVDAGMAEWSKVDGEAGKSCQSCHKDAAKSMKGVGTRYPMYDPGKKKLVALEHRINMCRKANMKAKPFKWESKALLGLTAYVKTQSRGMPMKVSIDGPAKEFFEKGKAFYYQRRGQLDLACSHCHEDLHDIHIRAEKLSQGMNNGFPTYRLKKQGMLSFQKRIQGCNKNIRAEPYPPGSDEYTNLELYVAWRASGLPVETPSVRK
ncbi:MAG: sulfur oxidation c-type cytochrome SoxA [Alphaproteobacteria bacterium]